MKRISFVRPIQLGFCLGLLVGIGFLIGKLSFSPTLSSSDLTRGAMFSGQKVGPWVKPEDDTRRSVRDVKNVEKLDLTFFEELTESLATQPVAEPVSQKIEAPVEKAPSQEKMAEALAKVLGPETPGAVTNSIKPQLPLKTGSAYAVQVASLPDREAAMRVMQKLQAKGYPARVVQAVLEKRGTVYRVRLHGFTTYEEAENYRKKFEKEEGLIGALTIAQ